jgi:cell division protein FtsW
MAQRLRTDWTLFFTVMVLAIFGLVMIYTSSIPEIELRGHNSFYFVIRQSIAMALGLAALMWIQRLDYRVLRRPVFAFGGVGVILSLLIAAYFLDPKGHRWLRWGALQVQPSELAKPALAIFLAWFVAKRLAAINSRYTLGPAALLVGLLAGLVLAGDMGTMVVLLAMVAAVFYVAGINRRYAALAVLGIVVLGAAGLSSQPYRMRRLILFADPQLELTAKLDESGKFRAWLDTSMSSRDTNYQARQSKIAVGSGGVLGLGIMQGRHKMLYVPKAHTDFIFAVIGEELGLWGSAGVVVGFVILMWRGFRLFWTAPDDFGRYLALALTAGLAFQAFINMSVALDLGPTKGLPLPLISYGGTSMLSSLISLGLLLSVSERSG